MHCNTQIILHTIPESETIFIIQQFDYTFVP